jgi:hypothetical protein
MRAFNVAPDGANVTFNRNLGPNWRVTLGGNRTLKIGNMQRGQEINILLQQDSAGNRSVTWPAAVKWATGVAPTLQTDASAVDMFTFRYDGTYLHEVSGSGVQAINKVLATALAVVTVALGAVGVTTYMTGDPGDVSDAVQQYTQSGAVNTMVYRRLGSGGVLISGSGEGLAIVNNLRATSKVTDGAFYATPAGLVKATSLTLGETTITGDEAVGWMLGNITTLSGATLSGATVTGGGGTQTLAAAGSRFTSAVATSFSGATIYAGGLATNVWNATTLRSPAIVSTSTLSGATTLTLSALAAQTGAVLCVKDNGVIGYQALTSSGTLTAGGCQ